MVFGQSLLALDIWNRGYETDNCSSVSPLQFGLGYLEQETVLHSSVSPFIFLPWMSGTGIYSVRPLQFGLGYLEQENFLPLVFLQFVFSMFQQECYSLQLQILLTSSLISFSAARSFDFPQLHLFVFFSQLLGISIILCLKMRTYKNCV